MKMGLKLCVLFPERLELKGNEQTWSALQLLVSCWSRQTSFCSTDEHSKLSPLIVDTGKNTDRDHSIFMTNINFCNFSQDSQHVEPPHPVSSMKRRWWTRKRDTWSLCWTHIWFNSHFVCQWETQAVIENISIPLMIRPSLMCSERHRGLSILPCTKSITSHEAFLRHPSIISKPFPLPVPRAQT